MKHYRKEIYQDPENLSSEAIDHILICSECRNEKVIMESIIRGLRAIPQKNVPESLYVRLFAPIHHKAMQPLIWSLFFLIGFFTLMVVPLVMRIYFPKDVLSMPVGYYALISVFFGIGAALLAVAFSIQLSQNGSPSWVQKYEKFLLRHL